MQDPVGDHIASRAIPKIVSDPGVESKALPDWRQQLINQQNQ
jgi:hypothetical protein